MSRRTPTISHPDDLLLSLEESPEELEAKARLLLAVKLFALGRISARPMVLVLAGVAKKGDRS